MQDAFSTLKERVKSPFEKINHSAYLHLGISLLVDSCIDRLRDVTGRAIDTTAHILINSIFTMHGTYFASVPVPLPFGLKLRLRCCDSTKGFDNQNQCFWQTFERT